MSRRLPALLLSLPLLTALACNGLAPATPTTAPLPGPSDTPLAAASDTPAAPGEVTATVEAGTASETPGATVTSEAPPVTDTPFAPADQTYLAYIRGGQLVVANVTGDVLGGATQYTSAGVDDAVYDLVWSPSGEFIAFTSFAVGDSHLFVVYAEGAGTPVDLGPGSAPSWSPDSLQLAYIRDDNIWVTPIDSPAPQQLSFETNWGWGRPAFLPDGSALLVSGTSRDNMGAQGNTQIVLQHLALDGSGTLTPLAASIPPISGRLPLDLAFSPDGAHIAFSSSFHLSACATSSDYYVGAGDGSGLTPLDPPSLKAMENPATDTYFLGLAYDWAPNSQSIIVQGQVMSCAPENVGTMLGVQVSILNLDGTEGLVLPGFYSYPSFGPTGDRFAVGLAPDFAAPASRIHIYDLAGSLVLDVDEGWQPSFQPPAPTAASGASVSSDVEQAVTDYTVVEVPIQGVNHIDVGAPHDPYNSEPPTSGPHYASPVEAGIYVEVVPDEYLVHNMEHGHIILWYNCSDLSAAECDDLLNNLHLVMTRAGLSDVTFTLKLVAVPRPQLATRLALTSWGHRQFLPAFDADTILAFIRAYRDQAPEPNAP